MSKVIKKKILPKYFTDVASGRKQFELRADEDNVQPGDLLILQEFNGKFTEAEIQKVVRYVLRDVPEYGLKEGYCIIGW